MKKLLIRSKSETDWFRDKENLDTINNNLKKFKKTKVKNTTNAKPELSNPNNDGTKTNKNMPISNIVAKQDLKNKNNIISKEESLVENESENDKKKGFLTYENNIKDYLKKIVNFKLQFDRKYFDKEIELNKNFVNINLEIILNILRNFKEKQMEKFNLNLENNNFSLSMDSGDSSMDSPDINSCKNSSLDDKNNKKSIAQLKESDLEDNENFIDNLEKFEQIVEILIKTNPEDLFKEVKSIILIEYETTINQIKFYLEQNKNETSKKFLTCISSNILFIISTITYKLDYYTITVNCLVDKFNKFLTHFVESRKDFNNYVKSLDLVLKFVKIKKTFMKEFIDNKQKLPEENFVTLSEIGNSDIAGSGMENSVTANSANENFNEKIFYNFAFNKFCSFGRYFFNNIHVMLDFTIYIEADYSNRTGINYEKLKDEFGCIINVYKRRLIKRERVNFFIWKKKQEKYETQKYMLTLDKYFRMFFTSKLAGWKYAMIQPGVKKIEICRICETTFEINEFVLHLFFCKELRMNNQSLIEIKQEMKKVVDKLKTYRQSLLKDKSLKDIFFSPKSDFNQIYRMHVIERTPLLINKMKLENNQNSKYFLFGKLGEKANLINQIKNQPSNNSNNNINNNNNSTSEVEFLDKIIQTYSKERDLTRDYYEKNPNKLSQLISIVHFTIYIFVQNKNSPNYNQELNEIFAKLFVLTMKKFNLIENILSLKNSKESARMKLRNNPKNKSRFSAEEKENKTSKEDKINTYNKEENIFSTEKANKENVIAKIILEDNKKIKNEKSEVEQVKEPSNKKIRNINKNLLEMEKLKKDFNIINITNINKADKDNSKLNGSNYLAKFTKIRSAQIPNNITTALKENEKMENEIRQNDVPSTIILSNTNISDINSSKSKNEKDEKDLEEEKLKLDKAKEKLINRAYCGPYLKTRNFNSSQETFQSSYRKKSDFLSLIKEKDENKADIETSIQKNIINENDSEKSNLINPDDQTKNNINLNYSNNKKIIIPTLDLKAYQNISNKRSELYAHQVSAQFTNIPKTNRTLKKDSLKDFCEMLDLTKSKLQTRRFLNKNDSSSNTNQSKNFLQAFAPKKTTESVLNKNQIENDKNLSATKRSLVKNICSELKNLSKPNKMEDENSGVYKNFFLHPNTVSVNPADNPLDSVNGINNNNVSNLDYDYAKNNNNNNNYGTDNFEAKDLNNFKSNSTFNNTFCNNSNNINKLSSPNSIENYSRKNYTVNIQNKSANVCDMENSNSCFNTNNTNSTNANNLTQMFLNNTANNNNLLLLTPGNNINKNNSILKKSLFDKTPSPNTVAKEEKLKNILQKESERLLLSEDSNKNISETLINQEMEKLNLENRKLLEINKPNPDDNYFSSTDSYNSNQFKKPQSMEIRANINKIENNYNNNNNNKTTNFISNLDSNNNLNDINNNKDGYLFNNNTNINNNNTIYDQNSFNPQSDIMSRKQSRAGFRKFNSLKLENYDIRNEILLNGNNFNNKISSDDIGDEYYTGSIKFLQEEKPSQKTLNSDLDLQIRNLDSEISLNVNKYPASNSDAKSLTPNFRKSSSNLDIESSIDSSNINFPRNTDSRRFYKEESLVNEINDEVDSQFDEMIELMDDIQLSDPYRDIENEHAAVEPKPITIKISDFKLISEISKGGYGRVDLYKKISTGDIYAIKTVDIKKMKSKNISGLLKNEALIMNEIYSEYVVKCYYIFNDDKNYYYVMEYMSGGDLHHFLNEYSLGYETIQFIIAEVILALEYLHSKNIIHRDMKPENIVISSNGHFKLTDFGISEIGLLHNKYAITNKINPDSEKTQKDKWVDSGKILGTQNYMAPEVIKCEKITYKTDYWSVGVILYELFSNKTPFYNGNIEETFQNILNLRIDWETFDKEVEDQQVRAIAKDLISKFLIIDPNKRWGDTNLNEVKAHKFFENFDWANVKSMKNLLVLKHVAEKIKQSRQIKITAASPLNKINEEDENKNSNKFANNKDENLSKKGSEKIDKNSQKNSGNKDNENYNSNNNNSNKEEFNLFYSERIDNLNKKNEDVLKTNIKLKKIEIDTDDNNFTNLMHDLD